jgi:hypothetical protein
MMHRTLRALLVAAIILYFAILSAAAVARERGVGNSRERPPATWLKAPITLFKEAVILGAKADRAIATSAIRAGSHVLNGAVQWIKSWSWRGIRRPERPVSGIVPGLGGLVPLA